MITHSHKKKKKKKKKKKNDDGRLNALCYVGVYTRCGVYVGGYDDA